MQDQGLTRFGLQRGLSSWFADSRLSGSLYTQPHWELGPQRMNLRQGEGGQNSVYTSHLLEDVWEKAHCLVSTTVLTYW